MAAHTMEGVGDLASMSMAELASLPATLYADEMVLQEQSRSLALASFQVHIDCVDASSKITAELAELAATGASGHKSATEAASLVTGNLGSRLEDLLAEHSRVQRAIHHERELLDVAEFPAVAEACLRNGRYNQLLELSAMADGMAQRHPPGTPRHAVAAAIAVAVDDCRQRALIRIQEALSAPRLPLSVALDLVRPLRRLLKQQAERQQASLPHRAAVATASLGAGEPEDGAEPATADDVLAELFSTEYPSQAASHARSGPRSDTSSPKPAFSGSRLVRLAGFESWGDVALARLLQCRGSALDALLSITTSMPPLQRLRRSMDACRGAWVETPQIIEAVAAAFAGSHGRDDVAKAHSGLSDRVTEALAGWMEATSARAVEVVRECAAAIRTGSELALLADAVAFAMDKAAAHCVDRLPEAQAILRECAVRMLAAKLQTGIVEFASEVQRGAWAFLSAIQAASNATVPTEPETQEAASPAEGDEEKSPADEEPKPSVPRAPKVLLEVPPLARAANVFIRAMDEARRCRHVVGPVELPKLAAAYVQALAVAQLSAVSDDVISELQESDGHAEDDAEAARQQQARLSQILTEEFAPFTERVVAHLMR